MTKRLSPVAFRKDSQTVIGSGPMKVNIHRIERSPIPLYGSRKQWKKTCHQAPRLRHNRLSLHPVPSSFSTHYKFRADPDRAGSCYAMGRQRSSGVSEAWVSADHNTGVHGLTSVRGGFVLPGSCSVRVVPRNECSIGDLLVTKYQ